MTQLYLWFGRLPESWRLHRPPMSGLCSICGDIDPRNVHRLYIEWDVVCHRCFTVIKAQGVLKLERFVYEVRE